jgi:hypothetical protein
LRATAKVMAMVKVLEMAREKATAMGTAKARVKVKGPEMGLK